MSVIAARKIAAAAAALGPAAAFAIEREAALVFGVRLFTEKTVLTLEEVGVATGEWTVMTGVACGEWRAVTGVARGEWTVMTGVT